MMMNSVLLGRRTLGGLILSLICLAGCPAPKGDSGNVGSGASGGSGESAADRGTSQTPEAPARAATAKAEDVDAAKKLLDGLGANAKHRLLPGGVLTEIVIQDGSVLTAENIALFGKLTDLETLQIYNFRELNDEMASQLAGLKQPDRVGPDQFGHQRPDGGDDREIVSEAHGAGPVVEHELEQ